MPGSEPASISTLTLKSSLDAIKVSTELPASKSHDIGRVQSRLQGLRNFPAGLPNVTVTHISSAGLWVPSSHCEERDEGKESALVVTKPRESMVASIALHTSAALSLMAPHSTLMHMFGRVRSLPFFHGAAYFLWEIHAESP